MTRFNSYIRFTQLIKRIIRPVRERDRGRRRSTASIFHRRRSSEGTSASGVQVNLQRRVIGGRRLCGDAQPPLRLSLLDFQRGKRASSTEAGSNATHFDKIFIYCIGQLSCGVGINENQRFFVLFCFFCCEGAQTARADGAASGSSPSAGNENSSRRAGLRGNQWAARACVMFRATKTGGGFRVALVATLSSPGAFSLLRERDCASVRERWVAVAPWMVPPAFGPASAGRVQKSWAVFW